MNSVEYTDISEIIQRLNSLYEEKQQFQDAKTRQCCDCKQIKSISNFQISKCGNRYRCYNCRTIYSATLEIKMKIREYLNEVPKYRKAIELLKKTGRNSGIVRWDCDDSKCKHEYDYYLESIACSSCNKFSTKIKGVILKIENNAYENISNEHIKVRSILMILNNKLKNYSYDASKF